PPSSTRSRSPRGLMPSRFHWGPRRAPCRPTRKERDAAHRTPQTVPSSARRQCLCSPRIGVRCDVGAHGRVLGFEVGMFAGSIASGTVLGAPDLVVLTLTE